jgi:hypothetical protein
MSNYLETLVEKMVADGVSEQDIKSVIEEVNSKKSPLHQVVAANVSTEKVEDTKVKATSGVGTGGGKQPVSKTGTSVIPETSEKTELTDEECVEKHGDGYCVYNGQCYRCDAIPTDEDEQKQQEVPQEEIETEDIEADEVEEYVLEPTGDLPLEGSDCDCEKLYEETNPCFNECNKIPEYDYSYLDNVVETDLPEIRNLINEKVTNEEVTNEEGVSKKSLRKIKKKTKKLFDKFENEEEKKEYLENLFKNKGIGYNETSGVFYGRCDGIEGTKWNPKTKACEDKYGNKSGPHWIDEVEIQEGKMSPTEAINSAVDMLGFKDNPVLTNYIDELSKKVEAMPTEVVKYDMFDDYFSVDSPFADSLAQWWITIFGKPNTSNFGKDKKYFWDNIASRSHIQDVQREKKEIEKGTFQRDYAFSDGHTFSPPNSLEEMLSNKFWEQFIPNEMRHAYVTKSTPPTAEDAIFGSNDMKNEFMSWSAAKQEVFFRFMSSYGDNVELDEVFLKEEIKGSLNSEKDRVISNSFKEADTLFWDKDGNLKKVYEIDGVKFTKEDLQVTKVVYDAYNRSSNFSSYALEYLQELNEKAIEDEKKIMNHYFDMAFKRCKMAIEYVNNFGKKESFVYTLDDFDGEGWVNEEEYNAIYELAEDGVTGRSVRTGKVPIITLCNKAWGDKECRPFVVFKNKQGKVLLFYIGDANRLRLIRSNLQEGITRASGGDFFTPDHLTQRGEKLMGFRARLKHEIGDGKLGEKLITKTGEKIAAVLETIQNDKLALIERSQKFKEDYQPTLDEALLLIKEIDAIHIDEDSSEVEIVYAAQLFLKWQEIESDYKDAVTEMYRISNSVRDLVDRSKLLSEQWDLIDKTDEFLTAWDKNYSHLSKTLSNLTSMIYEMGTTLDVFLPFKVFSGLAMEQREFIQKEYPQTVQWKDEASFGIWFTDMMVENTGNTAALLTSLINPWISVGTFFTWTTGGKYTTFKQQKITAEKYKEKLLSLLEDPNLTDIKKERVKEIISQQETILERSELNERSVSILFGGITALTERFGSIAVIGKWRKLKWKPTNGLIQNLWEGSKMWLKGTSIEITEEMIDQFLKNGVDVMNGEDKGIFDGFNADFFANVVAFSMIVNGIGGAKPMFALIRQSTLTRAENIEIQKLTDDIDRINKELDKSKRQPKMYSKKQIADLKTELAETLKKISDLETNIIAKLDLIKDEYDENGTLIETKGEKIKRVFELAKLRNNVLKEAGQMGSEMDFDKKKLDKLKEQFEGYQDKIDEFFKNNGLTDSKNITDLRTEQEQTIKIQKDMGIDVVKRTALLNSYLASSNVGGASMLAKGKFMMDITSDFDITKGETAPLDKKQKDEIRKKLKAQGFTDKQIESEIAEINKSAKRGKSNGFVSKQTGNVYIFDNFIKTQILIHPNDMVAGDAAATVYHEIFHKKHTLAGILNDDGTLKESYEKAVKELKDHLIQQAKDGKISAEVLEHFQQRLKRYDGTADQTEEILNIIGDLMFWGGVQESNLNGFFRLKMFMNSLKRAVWKDGAPMFDFNTPGELYRYISRYHTESKGGFVKLTQKEDDLVENKHALSAEEKVELTKVKAEIMDLRNKFIEDKNKIEEGLHTIEGKEKQEKLRDKLNEDLEDLIIRQNELEGTSPNQEMTLEERSKRVQEIYESDDLSQSQKEVKILALMQPYITTISKVWDFGLEKQNKEQAYKFDDFRKDLEYWIVKHVQQYKPGFGQTLSSYIMHNTKLKIPHLLEYNLVDNPVDITKIDVVDDSGGGFVESTVDQFVNSKLRNAFGIEKGSPIYNEIFETVKNELLERTGELSLEDALDTPQKKKKFRTTLENKFTESFKDIIKQVINPTNIRGKDATFESFLITNKKMIIDMLAVKYKKRFPELSVRGPRMDRGKSIESQTSFEGSFVSNIDGGNYIWIKNYDISDADFVALFAEGRETRYKSLLNSLAAELGLDAVFDALPGELESVVGKIVETIKRDPMAKFSLTPKFKISGAEMILNGIDFKKYLSEVGAISRLIRGTSYEDVIDEENIEVRGEVGKFSKEAIATVIYANEQVGMEGNEEIKFKEDLYKWLKENGYDNLEEQYRKDGRLSNNNNIDEDGKGALDRQFDEVSSFIEAIGYDAYIALGNDMFNFHYRGMDVAKTKKGLKRTDVDSKGNLRKFSKENKSGGGSTSYLIDGWIFLPESGLFRKINDKGSEAKGTESYDPVSEFGADLIRGEFYEQHKELIKRIKNINKKLPDYINVKDVRMFNSSDGLMDRIYKQVLSAEDYDYSENAPSIEEQKMERFERLFGDEVRKANIANIALAEHVTEELINNVKLSQKYKNKKEADKAVIALFHFLQAQTSLKNGFRGLTRLDFISLEKTVSDYLDRKGEHIDPNGNTMFELATLAIKAINDDSIDVKSEIRKIFKNHAQWLGPKSVMDIMDKLFGTNSTLGLDRIAGLLEDIRKTIFYIDGSSFDEKKEQLENLTIQRETNIEIEQEIDIENKKTEREDKRNELIKESKTAPYSGGTVLDFDLTVGESDNVVIATSPDGKTTRDLDGKEWAEDGDKLLNEGWTMDFSDFNNITNPKTGPVFPYLIKQLKKFGPDNVHILTARAAESQDAILKFINSRIDEHNEKTGESIPHLKYVKGLGDSTGKAKADWIEDNLIFNGVNDIVFIDDHLPNVQAVQDMFDLYPDGFFKDAKSIVTIPEGKESKTEKFNSMLERVKNIKANKKFSAAQAKLHGKKKGRWQFIINPSADDFEGLLRAFAGKGKQGEADIQWLKDNLIKPFSRGIIKINQTKQQIKNDYKKLRDSHPGIKKTLKENILRADGGSSNFTKEDAVRVYLFTKNGHDVPGLSKRDIKLLKETIEKDPNLKLFADGLNKLTNTEDGYVKPDEFWLAGGIATDMLSITNEIGRKENLTEWIKIKNEIFSPENLNKIEAAYGSDFREMLEEMLYKMEYGKAKRNVVMGKKEQAWLDWISGSTGAIMFLNTRSAILQLTSAMNYIELTGPNNLAASAAAFANQKQFWSDFLTIWNSDFLKERRGGLQSDINMRDLSAILDRVSGGPLQKAKAVIAWMLKMGFTPTQIADAFAISFGGASYYRNYAVFYLAQGLSTDPNFTIEQAEKMAWEKLIDNTESSQQSTRADMMSYEQASILGKFMLNFKNTPMQYTRKIVKAIDDLRKGRGSVKQNIATILYYGALQNIMFVGLQQAVFMALYDEDDEWDKKSDRAIKSMIDNILYGMGLEGAIIVSVKNGIIEYFEQDKKGWNADHTYTLLQFVNLSPVIGSKLRKIYSSIKGKQLNEDVIEKMDWWDPQNPAWNIVSSLVEGFTNLPADRALRKVQNLIAAAELESNSSEEFEKVFMQKLMMVLGWNAWDVDAKTDVKIIKEEIKEEKKENKEKEKKKNKETEIHKDVIKEKEENKDVNTCSAVNSQNVRCKNKVDKAGDKCAAHGGGGKQCSFIKPNSKRCKLLAVNNDGRCNTPQHQVGYKK